MSNLRKVMGEGVTELLAPTVSSKDAAIAVDANSEPVSPLHLNAALEEARVCSWVSCQTDEHSRLASRPESINTNAAALWVAVSHFANTHGMIGYSD